MTKNHEFDGIYTKYKNLVLKAAYSYTKDLELAQDIMQETFLALYRDMDKKGDLQKYRNIESWLYTTAKHFALNYKKKVGRETYGDEAAGEDSAVNDTSRGSTEEEYLDVLTDEGRAALHERIFAGLAAKNPRWHEAIMLTCYLEIPQVEAAKMMDMTESAFYVMLHRARNWIRKNYGAEYDELNRL